MGKYRYTTYTRPPVHCIGRPPIHDHHTSISILHLHTTISTFTTVHVHHTWSLLRIHMFQSCLGTGRSGSTSWVKNSTTSISVISRRTLKLADIFRSFQNWYTFTCPSSLPDKRGRRHRYHSQSWSWARLCHRKLEKKETKPDLHSPPPWPQGVSGVHFLVFGKSFNPGVKKTTNTWYNSRRPRPTDHQTWRTVTHSCLGHTPGEQLSSRFTRFPGTSQVATAVGVPGTVALSLPALPRALPGGKKLHIRIYKNKSRKELFFWKPYTFFWGFRPNNVYLSWKCVLHLPYNPNSLPTWKLNEGDPLKTKN